MRQSLRKSERLKNRKMIDALFRGAHSCHQYPITLLWKAIDESGPTAPILFGVSVPKRKIRSAVKRNLIKRRIREAYRLHKNHVLQRVGTHAYAVMLIYTAKTPIPFQEIQLAIKDVFDVFIQRTNPK